MFVLKTGKGDWVSVIDVDESGAMQVMATPDIEHAMMYSNLCIASMALTGFCKLGCEFTIEEVE